MKKLWQLCIIVSSCTVIRVDSFVRPRRGVEKIAQDHKQLIDDFNQHKSKLTQLLNDTQNALNRKDSRSGTMLSALVALNAQVRTAFENIQKRVPPLQLQNLVNCPAQEWQQKNTNELARIHERIRRIEESVRPPSPEIAPQVKRQKVEQPMPPAALTKNTLQSFVQALQHVRTAFIQFDEEYRKADSFDAQAIAEILDHARQQYDLAFDAFGLLQESFLKLDAQQRHRLTEQLGRPVEAWTAEQFNLLKAYRHILDQKNRAVQSTQAHIALALIKQSEDWMNKARHQAAHAIMPIAASQQEGDLFRRAVEIIFVADDMNDPLALQNVVKNLKGALFGLMNEEQLDLLRADMDYFDNWLTKLTQNLQESADRLEQQKLAAASLKAEQQKQAAAVVQPTQEVSRPISPMHIDEKRVIESPAPKSPLERLRERKRAVAQKPKGDAIRNINQQLQAKKMQKKGNNNV